jgi:hypothetical protein
MKEIIFQQRDDGALFRGEYTDNIITTQNVTTSDITRLETTQRSVAARRTSRKR